MLTLKTLGQLDLRDSAGREIRTVLQQPKRLALAAYLAIAAPGRLVRRDVLLALFWPELDAEHARAALRRSLYFLRRAMGEETLRGRGDEEIGIPEGRLWCDAAAFEEALRQGEREAALRLYGGPLLQGFYVAGAPEAERWLDQTRSRLAQRAAAAAWGLAEEPGRPPAESAEWGRRAVGYLPDDEQGTTRLVGLLDRLGDPGGALRAYQEYRRQLRLDADAEPGRELTALASAIRDREPRHADAATGPGELLAVLPFTVRGDSALDYLAEGLVDLLGPGLDGAGELRVADSRVLLAALRDAPGTPSPELSRRLGVTLWVQGSVVASGGRLQITARMADAAGRTLARAEARGEDETALFEMVDELVRQLLVRRGSGPGERLTRLAGRTTESLPALRAWLQGEHQLRLGGHAAALEAYRQATEADPGFALAHYRVASAAAANALIGPARLASERALRHRDRLSDRDRLLVEAQHAWLRGAAAEAERRYAAVVALHPDDVEAWFLLGDVQFHSNPYRGRSIREARDPLQRALALEPRHVGVLTRLARLAALDRRRDELAALVDQALHLSPEGETALGLRALRAFALGEAGPAGRVTQELKGARALTIGIAFSDLTLYAGDPDAVETLGRELTGAVRSAELRAVCHLMLAHFGAARSDLGAVERELATAAGLEPIAALEARGLLAALPFLPWPEPGVRQVRTELEAWDPSGASPAVSLPLAFHNELHPHLRAYLVGLLSARLGDRDGLAHAMEQLAEADVPLEADSLVERLERSLAAELALQRGDIGGALGELAGARGEVWFQYAVGSPFFTGAFERWRRADLLVRLGRGREAAGWFGSIAERSPWELPYAEPARRRAAELDPAG